jgi:EAL domain-containing protein (putative c-di-GMP-specific phosphodiesterase class I)
MEDEQGRMAQPATFLGAAERYDLAVKIDRWVVEEAFAWLARHQAHLARLHLCAINLSGHSLADAEFIDFVIGEFDRTGVAPEKLCFEITETAAIANLANAIRFIARLQALGCRFALDDFGSGLSSFAYLKNLPVDFLKIDGLFVRDTVNDPIDYAMVKCIHEMGRMMGKRTIAEFVETTDILAKVRDIGVDYAQGYGIGRPRPIEEIAYQSVPGSG